MASVYAILWFDWCETRKSFNQKKQRPRIKALLQQFLNFALQSQGIPSGTKTFRCGKGRIWSCWLLKTEVRTAFFLGLGLCASLTAKKGFEIAGSKVSSKTKACCLGFLCPNFGSTSWSGKWIRINNRAYHHLLWTFWRISYDLHTTGYFTPNLK